jgi:hypothetical protein
VRRGARPLREDRVAEWLHRKIFSASEADMLPAHAALSVVARHSIALAAALDVDVDTNVGNPSIRRVSSLAPRI